MAENIIKKLALIRGWEEKAERSPLLTSMINKTDDVLPCEISRNRRYQLVATIGIDFWANDAQLVDGIISAKNLFARRVYGDIESLVQELLHQINYGDKDDAVRIAHKILDYIKA